MIPVGPGDLLALSSARHFPEGTDMTQLGEDLSHQAAAEEIRSLAAHFPVGAAAPIDTTSFADRHVGPDASGIATILSELGQSDLDAWAETVIPAAIHDDRPLDLPEPATEAQALAELRALAAKNTPLVSMIGLGYHDTLVPGVIKRNVLENPAWYTAYTPY